MPIIANDKYYIIKANGKYYDIYNPFKTFTFTIVPTPLDATVTLTAQGYTQVGNSITVRKGTTVNWSVSKNEYYTQTGSITVNKDTVQDVSLVYAMATLTIAPTPSDSTVTLTASGYTQVGNTIKVQKGTTVNWSVSKTNYYTQTGSITVDNDTTQSVGLVYALATLTINPTPSDATVTLSATGYSQVGKSITVEKGTSVSWNVSKSGYVTQSGSQAVNADETKSITLERPLYYCYYYREGNLYQYHDSLVTQNGNVLIHYAQNAVRANNSSELTNVLTIPVSNTDPEGSGYNGIVNDRWTRSPQDDLYT